MYFAAVPGNGLAVPIQPSFINYFASRRRAKVDDSVAKQMNKSILEYNDRVPHAAWSIQVQKQTVLIALYEATPTTISLLEDHYSSVCHMDGALITEQLGFCNFWVGISRIPNDRLGVPAIWKTIMNVSPEAIEEFVWNLACLLAGWYWLALACVLRYRII